MYERGLHVFRKPVSIEKLKLVTDIWQEASKLYRETGDESKAREIEKTLVGLCKRKSIKIGKKGGEQNNGVIKFNSWDIFFKIGCFGFGGPMAVFTLLENELVRKEKILTDRDFLKGAVLGDILPGPVTMDIVTYVGYRLKKWSGAVISTLLFILPSFVLMVFLAALYSKYSITPRVETVFKCLGAAVTGLIISVGLKLGESEIKDYRAAGILIWAFASALIFNFDILTIVGISGLSGVLLFIGDTEKGKSDENIA